MNKDVFLKQIMSEAFVSFEYKPVFDIEKRYVDFERALSEVFEKGGVLTKVPDNSPPMIPRFVLESKNNRSLEVSIVNATLKFAPRGLNYSEALNILKSKASTVFKYIVKQKSFEVDIIRIGFLIKLGLKDIDLPIHEKFFDEYFKFARPENLSFCNFEYSTKNGHFNEKVKFENYEEREITLEGNSNPPNHYFKLSTDKMKKIKAGIAVRVTIETTIDKISQHEDVHAFYKNTMAKACEKVDSQIEFLIG